MKRLLVILILMACPAFLHAQQTSIQATVVDPNGTAYAGGTGSASINCPGNQQPTYNGFTVPRNYTIVGMDGFGHFTLVLFDVNLILPAGCSYNFFITSQNGLASFTAPAIGGSSSGTPVTGAGPVNLSTPINAYAVPIPSSGGGGSNIRVNGSSLANPNFNSTTPVPDAGNTAATYKVSGQNVISQMPACTSTVGGLVPTPPNDLNQVLLGTCAFGAIPGPLGNLTIFATNYGLKHDGLNCTGLSSTMSVVSGNSTVSCSNATFTSPADVGKYIFITTGCGGKTANYAGVLLYKGTIASVTNSTTIVLSGTAPTGNCTTTCNMTWGTLDDTPLSAAETAWAAVQPCGALALPSGLILVKEPHFNPTFSHGCQSVTFTQDYAGTVYGQGPASTILVPVPDYDFAACPASTISGMGGYIVCNFNYISPVIKDLGFNGGGWGNTGNHNMAFIGLMQGAQADQLVCANFGGSDASMYGIVMGFGARAKFLISDGCGERDIVSLDHSYAGTAEAWNYCYYCFGADSIGPSLVVSGGPFYDYGGEWAPMGSTIGSLNTENSDILVTNGGEHQCFGCSNFVLDNTQNAPAGNTVEYVDIGSTAYLYGANFDNNTLCASVCYGLVISPLGGGTATGSAYVSNSKIRGATFAVVNGGGFGGNGGGFWDLGGNQIGTNGYVASGSGAGIVYGDGSINGTACAAGNLVASGGWGASAAFTAVSGGSKRCIFTLTNTGSGQGASPTITFTYPVPFLTATNLVCTAVQVGGTQGLTTTANLTPGTPTKTAVVFTYNGTPTVNLTEIIVVTCGMP